MWVSLSNFFYRISTGWLVLAALVVILLFMIFALPGQSNGEVQFAVVPDLSIYYSARSLYRMAETYGEEGRAAYIYARFTFDLVWPIVYGLFLITIISWIYGRILSVEGMWKNLNLVPFLGMLSDYLENISTSIVLWRFPAVTPVISSLAGIFTLSKWILIGISFVLLILGCLLAIWKWLRNWRIRT